jgi:hypothetical protein
MLRQSREAHPRARALGLGREEGVEDTLAHCCRDSGTVVGKGQDDAAILARLPNDRQTARMRAPAAPDARRSAG